MWKILNRPEIQEYGSFLKIWGEQFFKPGLKWIEHGLKDTQVAEGEELSASGYRAQEMPEQVRTWKAQVQTICEEYEDTFSETITIMGGGEAGKQKCKAMVQKFGARIQELIDQKFGAWTQAPLCLAEMLQPGKQRTVPTALVDKYQAEGKAPPGIGGELWKALQEFVDAEKGVWIQDYDVKLDDGRTVDLLTYVEATFKGVCIHNADPERCTRGLGLRLRLRLGGGVGESVPVAMLDSLHSTHIEL